MAVSRAGPGNLGRSVVARSGYRMRKNARLRGRPLSVGGSHLTVSPQRTQWTVRVLASNEYTPRAQRSQVRPTRSRSSGPCRGSSVSLTQHMPARASAGLCGTHPRRRVGRRWPRLHGPKHRAATSMHSRLAGPMQRCSRWRARPSAPGLDRDIPVLDGLSVPPAP